MSTSTWTGTVNSDWADADNWSPAGVPGAGSDVTIATGDAVASASIGTVNSITDSSDLDFESAGTNTVTTSLDDTGHLRVDHNGGAGGTILNIGGTLTDSGYLSIGNATLSAPDEVTAASIDKGGFIYLTGSTADQALLDVTAGRAGFGTAGGSSLSIATGLTNTGTLLIGSGGLSSSDAVTAKSFVKCGTVDLTGNGANFAALDVSGATTNNGSISIATDTEELAGAVSGAGSFSLNSADLLFDSSVSAGQTINKLGGGAVGLTLNEAQSFAATISGFGTGDTIDATNFVETATSYSFLENSMGSGGTLTLHDASLTANILMTGDYSNSSFTLAHDSGTGTLVKFV